MAGPMTMRIQMTYDRTSFSKNTLAQLTFSGDGRELDCLIIDCMDDKISILPINEDVDFEENAFFKRNEFIPKLIVPYKFITAYKPIDSEKFLYMLADKNPYIKKAIESYIHNEGKKDRKNKEHKNK